MFITGFALTFLGVTLSLLGARATFAMLGLDPHETLMWLGLAEVPPPPAPRRSHARVL